MMANRLQQMAMEERYHAGNNRRYNEYGAGGGGGGGVGGGEDDQEYGNNVDRGGMKRQMNCQGGNRGKKNRGGWNR